MMNRPARPYDDAFVAQQKKRLEEARSELLRNVAWDEEELLSWQDPDDNIDQHPADDATSTQEMELDLGLIANAQAQLAAIHGALDRVADGVYGWDDETGDWIPQDRLEALPWARRSIQGQRAMEATDDYDEEGYTHGDDVSTL